jgi:hypothetical protein
MARSQNGEYVSGHGQECHSGTGSWGGGFVAGFQTLAGVRIGWDPFETKNRAVVKRSLARKKLGGKVITSVSP